jgi:CheY-like chemotaxis protein
MPSIAPAPPDGRSRAVWHLNTSRIIVVDDEADSLELLKVILEQEGAIISTFCSPKAALQALTQSCFDLLISDIGMPDIDGYDLIAAIRTASPLNQAIPAIALTAFVGESNKRQAIAAGYQAHIAKPINPQELLEVSSRLVAT